MLGLFASKSIDSLLIVLKAKGMINDNEISWINLGIDKYFALNRYINVTQYEEILKKHIKHECKSNVSYYERKISSTLKCSHCDFQGDQEALQEEIIELILKTNPISRADLISELKSFE